MVDLTLGDTGLIIKYAKKHNVLRNQLAYILATAYHESAHTMKPVRETLASSDARAIRILNRAFEKGQLSWVSEPYWKRDDQGRSWLGRGYVQLTHKYNYQNADEKLGLSGKLVEDPSLAMDPKIAVPILVRGMMEGWFRSHKIDDYITLQRSNFVKARAIVNPDDQGPNIAGYAQSYDKALLERGYGVDTNDPDRPGTLEMRVAELERRLNALENPEATESNGSSS